MGLTRRQFLGAAAAISAPGLEIRFSAHERPGREEARRDMESKKGTAKRYGRAA